MFGSLGSSTARTTSTTKMHVIAADTDRVANLHSPGALNVASPASRKREPLHRAQTSGTSSRIQASLSSAHDFVLITRPFTAADSASTQQTQSQSKVHPAFAVALLVQLPTESRPTSRPASRNLLSPPGRSASSSLGSDLQSSWTDLSSLTSLTSSKYLAELTDHRIEQLVHNFNIVEDCLSRLQQIASSEIYEHVKQSDTHTLSAWALVENARLRNAAEDVVRRVALWTNDTSSGRGCGGWDQVDIGSKKLEPRSLARGNSFSSEFSPAILGATQTGLLALERSHRKD